MKRLMKIAFALCVLGSSALYGQGVKSADSSARPVTQKQASDTSKVMREYHGVKLGLKRDQVQGAMNKPESSTDSLEEYKLTGEDTMTVHYENGEVKAIQLVFNDPKNAPTWRDVVGDAEVSQTDSGAKHARKVMAKDNFWVSIWQNKDSTVTRITISR